MRRIKLILEYDGTGFHGWQFQPGLRTVQGVLVDALQKMTNEKIKLIAAGRTDAGVHALAQVAHFNTASTIPLDGFLNGLNSLLPDDLVVKDVKDVGQEFHAQRSAIGKRYLYRILNRALPSAIVRFRVWHIPTILDIYKMSEGCKYLIGKHDFSSFRASGSEIRGSVREIFEIKINKEKGDFINIIIFANGFLKQMARNIVGTLVEIGTSKYPPKYIKEILEAKDREKAGPTAPPYGLYLLEVVY
ncbi:MAG TPA: tRNA pseudouridine(38-40) synthase TruA [Candidatus Atribacteria bacterium]|nr:tRNA pseudouridine(38-40) synthase TruA [Candidatus Atribacteria bacterium]